MSRKPDIETVAVFFTNTQRLLLDAKNKRDSNSLRLAKDKIDQPRFRDLPDDAQEGLLELYAAAMVATGMAHP